MIETCPYLLPREVDEAAMVGGERALGLGGLQVYDSPRCRVHIASVRLAPVTFEVVRCVLALGEWLDRRETLSANALSARYGQSAADRWKEARRGLAS